MSKHYILDGHEVVAVPLMEWARWFEDNGNDRQVARTEVGASSVSTVFLGLDYSFGEGSPLIFETMVFGGPLADEMERYSSWSEAVAGHEAMVERVKQHPSDRPP